MGVHDDHFTSGGGDVLNRVWSLDQQQEEEAESENGKMGNWVGRYLLPTTYYLQSRYANLTTLKILMMAVMFQPPENV